MKFDRDYYGDDPMKGVTIMSNDEIDELEANILESPNVESYRPPEVVLRLIATVRSGRERTS